MSKRKTINQAARWAVRMQSDDTGTEEHKQFDTWLQESPENNAEYDKLSFLDQAGFDLADLPEARELLAQDLKNYQAPGKRRWWPGISTTGWVTTAVTVAVLVLVTTLNLPQPEPVFDQTYQTATGEQHKFDLPDGSSIDLNTRTQVQVLIDANRRQVILDQGEVFFAVAHDPEIPFEVKTDAGTITVIGTEFNVRQIAEQIIVSVFSGRVKVLRDDGRATLVLARGQQLVLQQDSGPEPVRQANFQRVTAWRQQQLIFDNTLLGNAVLDINQYIDGPIEIADPALQGIRISGVFRTGDSSDFIIALDNLVGIRTETTDDGVTRLYASKTSPR